MVLLQTSLTHQPKVCGYSQQHKGGYASDTLIAGTKHNSDHHFDDRCYRKDEGESLQVVPPFRPRRGYWRRPSRAGC